MEQFNTDWLRQYSGHSEVAVSPANTEEVAAVLRYCNENRLGVVPQSGNTGLVGGSVPLADEVVLSLRKMNRVISFDAVSGVLVCEAGCILEQLDNYLAPHGFAMPLDLGAKGSCLIGGNVATNAGGLRFLRYGSLHGSVLGLEAVLADGTVLDCLNTLPKDNVGFDVKQVFIGSEGALGVITKLAIKAVPKATKQVALLQAPSFEACAQVAVMARQHLGEVLSAVEMVDGHTMSISAALLHGYGAPPAPGYGPAATSAAAAAAAGASGAAALPAGSALASLPEDMLPERFDSLLARGPGATHGTPSRFYVVIETAGSNVGHDTEKLNGFLDAAMSTPEAGSGAAAGAEAAALVGNGVVAADEKQAAALWRLREESSVAVSRRGHTFKYDLSFPTPAMYGVVEAARGRMLEALTAASAARAARAPGALSEDGEAALASVIPVGYGHLFDGNIHLNVSCPTRWTSNASSSDSTSEASYHAAAEAALEPWVFEWTMARKGSISAEHGLGQAKAAYLPAARPAPVVAVMAGMKQLLDPRGILNPGKVLPLSLTAVAAE